jgi:hypothetical protein
MVDVYLHSTISFRGVVLNYLIPGITLSSNSVAAIIKRHIINACKRQWPITVAARSKARTVFAPSNAGIVGSNPTQGMDVCIMCVYSVFLLFYV